MRFTKDGEILFESQFRELFPQSCFPEVISQDNIEFTGWSIYVEPIPDPPPPYVPDSVTMRQARLQLLELGVLDGVNDAISGLGAAAQIEWEYAAVVDRNNPLTSAMKQLLQWSEDDLDSYFLAASQL